MGNWRDAATCGVKERESTTTRVEQGNGPRGGRRDRPDTSKVLRNHADLPIGETDPQQTAARTFGDVDTSVTGIRERVRKLKSFCQHFFLIAQHT